MRLFPVPEMPARSINGLVRIAVRKLNEELFFIFVSGKIDKEGEPSGFIVTIQRYPIYTVHTNSSNLK